MELSLVVPAFNEAKQLEETVAAVLAWIGTRRAELIVVDDGSTDATREILTALAARDARLVPVHLADNRGKGAAVAAGVRAARGDAIAFFDADLAYPLEQLDALLDALRDADLAVGARDLHPESHTRYGATRRLANAVFNGLVGAALGMRVRDTQCGFKAFRAPAARALFAAISVDGFGFDVELLFLAERWGLRVARVPVRMRTHGASSVRLVRDSVRMARDVLRIRKRASRGDYPSSSSGS